MKPMMKMKKLDIEYWGLARSPATPGVLLSARRTIPGRRYESCNLSQIKRFRETYKCAISFYD